MFDTVRLSADIARLPLPLAQTLRRALNAKSPQEAHTAAYYFFECALKLSASAQIGVYVALGCESAQLNELIENITRASTGHWLAILREVSAYLAKRPDKSLVPLADVSERLTKKEPRPAARAFLDFVVKLTEKPDGRKSLSCLDVFDNIVSYRNQELGHGAQRTRDFYAEAAPLIVDAAVEAVNALRPLGELQLAVARDVVDHKTSRAARLYQRLAGDGIQAPVTGVQLVEDDKTILAGRVVLAGGITRVILHPLVVYEVDELERDRVGFVNLVSAKRVAAGTQVLQRQKDGAVKRSTTQITVKKVEYLDYDSGARIEGQDATEELADLLTRLRGTRVTADSVDRLASETPTDGATGKAALPRGDGTGEYIGDFEILEELGRGGMGIVYKARQSSLGRIVALKVLPPALAGDPVAVTRFKREIAALGRCDHANVVKVLHAGQDGDRYFYAMEYVEGCDLFGVFGVMSQWMPQSHGKFREGHLLAALSSSMQLRKTPRTTPQTQQELDPDFEPLPDAPKAAPIMPQFQDGQYYYSLIAKIMADATSGVGHLHEHGIIHRDIKPANIMLTGDGKRAIIMDLGLAAVAGQKGLSVANSSARIVGTLRYMPPEQLQRHLLDITNKADIYSLGATLYELATLSPIFDGDSEARLIQQVLQEQPVPPRKANPSVPEDLATIITVATAKNPNERYPSADALARDLEAFARGDPISVRPPGALHYLKLFYKRNKALMHTAAAAVVVLIALTAWFMVSLNARRAEAEEARETAEVARTDAEKQRGLALEAARVAEDERKKAQNEERKARSAEDVAKKERDNAEREKEHAQNMERKANSEADRAEREAANAKTQEAEAKRQATIADTEAEKAKLAEREARVRYADSLVLQGDALMKANRIETARAIYEQSLEQARLLGIDTFPAESGLAVLRQQSPSAASLIPAQPFSYLEFACISQDSTLAALRFSSGMTVWDVKNWKALLEIKTSLARGPVALSPDNTMVAWASKDEIVVNTLADGKEIARFTAKGSPYGMEFSPDGSKLAACLIAGGLIEFDWRKGVVLRELAGTEGELHKVRYSRDGRWIATAGAACKVWVFDAADGKVVQTLAGHERYIFDICFSDDGTQLGSGGAEGKATVWSVANGKSVRAISLWGASIMSVRFSADGKRLLLGDFAGWCGLFSLENSKKLADFQIHHSGTLCTTLSADEKQVVTVGKNDCPRVYDLEGKPQRFVAGHHNVVNGMMLSKDGRKAIAASFGECVIVWDTMTGAEIRRFAGVIYSVTRVDVSADFKYALVWGLDGRATLWDVSTGDLMRTFPQRKGAINWAALSGDANLAAFALDGGEVEVWSVDDLKLKATIPPPGYRPDHLKFNLAADKLAVIYAGYGVGVYDLTKAKPEQIALIWGQFNALSFLGSDDTRLAIADRSRDAAIWSIEKQTAEVHLKGHEGMIWDIRSSDDGATLATYSADTTARIWSSYDGVCQQVCPGPDSGVKACAISGDGTTVALSGMDASLRFWSTQPAMERRAFTGHWGKVTCIAALPDGRFAVTGALDGDLRLWDLKTGACVRTISAHKSESGITAVKLVKPNVCVSAGYDKLCKVWDLGTGECLGVFSGHTEAVWSLEMMPDGRTMISTGPEKRVLMWDWTTLKQTAAYECDDRANCAIYWPQKDLLYVAQRNRHVKYFRLADGATGNDDGLYSTSIMAMAFAPDGSHFAVTGYGRVANVFSAVDGSLVLAAGGHADTITGIAFTPDVRYFVTSGDDGTIRFWNLADGKELRVIPHRNLKDGLSCFTPDGKHLLFCGGETTWHMWDFTRSALHESLPQQVRAAREQIQAGNESGEAYAALCRWYAFRGEMSRAYELLQMAEKSEYKFLPDFVLELSWQAKDFARALACLEEVRQAGTLSDFAYGNLRHGLAEACVQNGNTHFWAQNYEQAQAEFDRALSIEPTAAAHIGRGNVLAAKKENQAAIAAFTSALGIEPKNTRALTARGDVHAALRQFDKALADYVAVRDLEPGLAYRWQRVGEIRCELSDFKGAEKEFTKALELWDGYALAYYWRGWARQQLGLFEAALADDTRYCELAPETYQAWGQRGDLYRAMKRWKEAIADYDVAIRLAPENYYYYFARGDSRTRQGEFASAVNDFRKALDYGSPRGDTYYNMACAYCLWAKSLEKGTERWAIDKALETLELAVKEGWTDWQAMKTDADLEIIRTEPRFVKLLEGK
ncbi:MAG: protein kinase [Planctomycetes bacterium]|nr:protein kinase [Planctomycetota bacterium]